MGFCIIFLTVTFKLGLSGFFPAPVKSETGAQVPHRIGEIGGYARSFSATLGSALCSQQPSNCCHQNLYQMARARRTIIYFRHKLERGAMFIKTHIWTKLLHVVPRSSTTWDFRIRIRLHTEFCERPKHKESYLFFFSSRYKQTFQLWNDIQVK